ncbi:MAG: radical SAM peptide maturase, CXXX-repeat target family [Clostridia bacterium]|nr:radical SAM peptide maturase, CXXX-repeat target family [Clostridia bacterium]
MNGNNNIKMGQLQKSWKEGVAKTITFCVTEDCNLACKYCYMTGKNSKRKMTFEIAKKAVDYILSNRDVFDEEAVIWDFIGGEPFLEIDLIDKVSDYIKLKMYELSHPWFDNYIFGFSTNGLLYDNPKVQKYILKNRGHISIGISIDGNKIKHDLQRIRLDGSGSYDEVIQKVPLWQEQFPGFMTKATFSHDDLPYLKESIISLWENGIKTIAANVIYEDVWHEGDDAVFEGQLRELADHILENDLWKEYSVRFFDPKIGFPLTDDQLKKNWCGAGKMLAIDCDGKFYPCIRFLDFSLNNRAGVSLGDIENGINTDKIRPFLALNTVSQSSEECIKCDVAKGCAWCTGNNYDMAGTDTIYERSTFTCKMHKANVRANEYFWDKFTEVTGVISPREEYKRELEAEKFEESENTRFLVFLTSDDVTPHCAYRNWNRTNNRMSRGLLEEGLKFAEDNGFTAIFLGETNCPGAPEFNIVNYKSHQLSEYSIITCDNESFVHERTFENCILLVSRMNVGRLSSFVKELRPSVGRINVILEDIADWSKLDISEYEAQLDVLVDFISETYKDSNPLELNILTDSMNLKSMSNCDAGNNTYTLAPNGKIYMCPAFYFDNPDTHIGDLKSGISIKNSQLLKIENAPICSACDAYHCTRCKFLNKKLTNEINTPSKIQCVLSHIERNKARELQQKLIKQKVGSYERLIEAIEYLDPLEKNI